MSAFFDTGYDVVMVLWGIVFILAAAFFILLMNRVFSTEEQRQEELSRATETHQEPAGH